MRQNHASEVHVASERKKIHKRRIVFIHFSARKYIFKQAWTEIFSGIVISNISLSAKANFHSSFYVLRELPRRRESLTFRGEHSEANVVSCVVFFITCNVICDNICAIATSCFLL